MKIDTEQQPPFFDVSPTHAAATWLLHPDAPKVTPPVEIQRRYKIFAEQQETKIKADQNLVEN